MNLYEQMFIEFELQLSKINSGIKSLAHLFLLMPAKVVQKLNLSLVSEQIIEFYVNIFFLVYLFWLAFLLPLDMTYSSKLNLILPDFESNRS